MTRPSLALTTAAALVVSISGAALAQSVGGSAPGGNAGGALITPRSDPNSMPTQNAPGMGAPTNLGNGAGPSALTLPNVDKMSPAQIQARLQSSGYENIRNFTKQNDGGYTATAMKDGQPVKLRIEASSGRVITTND